MWNTHYILPLFPDLKRVSTCLFHGILASVRGLDDPLNPGAILVG